MSTRREPWEAAAETEANGAVNAVLDTTVENYASWLIAERDDLDPATCEIWVNAVWNGLRDGLDGEQRLAAIVLLLRDRAVERYHEIRRSLP